jgi:hypothetical protein
MNELEIEILMRNKSLRSRQPDTERVKSMIKSAEINAETAKKISLDDNSATLVFREIYESIRQLGDAKWWSIGYEPLNHETSLEILKDIDIKEKVKLNYLPRFKRIRNDANYRGFRVSVSQAKEIIEFWDKCSSDIIKNLLTK